MISVVCARGGNVLQRRADGLIGGDATGGDQRARRAVGLTKHLKPDGNAICDRCQHSILETKTQIADVLLRQRRNAFGFHAHGGLQARQREVGIRGVRPSPLENQIAPDCPGAQAISICGPPG